MGGLRMSVNPGVCLGWLVAGLLPSKKTEQHQHLVSKLRLRFTDDLLGRYSHVENDVPLRA